MMKKPTNSQGALNTSIMETSWNHILPEPISFQLPVSSAAVTITIRIYLYAASYVYNTNQVH